MNPKMAGYAFRLRSSSFGGQIGSNPPYRLSVKIVQYHPLPYNVHFGAGYKIKESAN
jgi:hypothetical protein